VSESPTMSSGDIIYTGFGDARKHRGEFRGYKNATEIETRFPPLPCKANPHLTLSIRGRFGNVMILHNVEYPLIPKVYNWRMYTSGTLQVLEDVVAG
jgi:hypothetical protein